MRFTRLLLVAVASLTAILISACSNENAQLKAQVDAQATEIAELKTVKVSGAAPASSPTATIPTIVLSVTPVPTTSPPTKPADEFVVIDQPVTIADVGELTFKKATFTDKVVPPKPTGFYTYYQVKTEGHTYLDIVVAYKNLEGSGKPANEVGRIIVLYDGKYEYTSFSTIEKQGGSDFTYTNITDIAPLTTGVLHFICEVPVEVRDSGKPIIATINISKHSYKLRIV